MNKWTRMKCERTKKIDMLMTFVASFGVCVCSDRRTTTPSQVRRFVACGVRVRLYVWHIKKSYSSFFVLLSFSPVLTILLWLVRGAAAATLTPHTRTRTLTHHTAQTIACGQCENCKTINFVRSHILRPHWKYRRQMLNMIMHQLCDYAKKQKKNEKQQLNCWPRCPFNTFP